MNTIINKMRSKNRILQGSIWKDEANNNFYILASVSITKYCAISLSIGSRWKEPNTMENAVEGLTFVAESAKITIRQK